jgi:hypothetical protein
MSAERFRVQSSESCRKSLFDSRFSPALVRDPGRLARMCSPARAFPSCRDLRIMIKSRSECNFSNSNEKASNIDITRKDVSKGLPSGRSKSNEPSILRPNCSLSCLVGLAKYSTDWYISFSIATRGTSHHGNVFEGARRPRSSLENGLGGNCKNE